MDIRTGIGYDVHKLVKNRDLVIGGVKIEYEFGLLGHSDADVLIHAIMDSLLGAAGLRDIGYYFPPGEKEFENISSLILLKKVNELLKEKYYHIINIDSILMAEKPKIGKYVDIMKKNISEFLEISIDRIGVKATTTEKLGFVGREEGMAAMATSLLERIIIND